MSRPYRGYVEVVAPEQVSGWCLGPRQGEAVTLELLLRGQVLARCVTALDRPDLAGMAGGHRLAGFAFHLATPLPADARAGDLLVRPVGGAPLPFLDPAWRVTEASAAIATLPPPPAFPSLAEARAAHRAPRPFPLELPAAPASPGALQGALDPPAEGMLTGHAFRRQAPPLLLLLQVDGQPAGRVLADGPGGGFALPLPDALFDDAPHELAVLEALSGEALPGSPLRLRLRAGEGFARLRRGVLEGEVGFGDRAAARLEVLVDGAPHPALPPRLLRRAEDARGRFSIALPPALHDGTARRIAVLDAGRPLAGPPITLRNRLRGRVEGFEEGIIAGWAEDARRPGAPVTVALFEDGRKLAETVTALPRPELGEGTPGFALPVPRALFDGRVHRLRVALGGVDLCLGDAREITGTLSGAAVALAGERFRGQVEMASPELVSGWAIDTLAADRPATVAIELDGVLVGTARADRFQPRLRSLSPHGQHGFEWPVPAECWNGRERELVVRIVGAPEPLAGSPSTLRFPGRLLPPPAGQPPRPRPRPVRPAPTALPGLVSAVVLNRNGAALLEALFASIHRHVRTPLEVVLVDHGSTDESLAIAARWQGRLAIRVEALARNQAFGVSSNQGAQLANGQHLLLLNNDIEFTHDPLPAMLRALGAPGVAAVGARLAEPVVQADGSLRPVLHHDGIGFRLLHGAEHGRSLWLPYEVEAEAADPAEGPDAVPAATAAMLLLRRADFLALGGFEPGFDYGLEDVDFCLRLGARLGQVVVARDAVAIHQRSATRGQRFAAALADPVQGAARGRELANRRLFLHRQGSWLARRIRTAALEHEGGWRPTRFRLGLLAEDAAEAEALAAALAEAEGWNAALLPPGEPDWRGLDAVLALSPDAAPRRAVNVTPGLLTAAWVRGDLPAWLAAGLEDYDRLFAASPALASALAEATGRAVTLLPPAADPVAVAEPLAEAPLLVVADWREDLAWLPAALRGLPAALLGEGWEALPAAQPFRRGSLPAEDLPAALAGARLVLATPAADGVLPAVAFAALAQGTPVLGADPAAAALLPGLPAFAGAEELRAEARRLLADGAARKALAETLRAVVLAEHGWAHRAASVAAALRDAAGRYRFGLKLAGEERGRAEALAAALRALGHGARLDPPGHWHDAISAGDDAALLLPGAEAGADPRSLAILWAARPMRQAPAGADAVLSGAPGSRAGWAALAEKLVALTQGLLNRR